MLHPLIKLLATQPDLLAAHLAGYGQLMAMQAGEAAAQLRVRALLVCGVALAGGMAMLFGGIALMFCAALPSAQMPMPWALWTVPLVPLAVALACGAALTRRPVVWTLEPLREQWAADAALLAEAGAR